MGHYYADHTVELRKQLGRELSTADLRRLHEKRPALHFMIALALLSVLVLSTLAIVNLHVWYLWLPVAFVSGFAIFDFTILLHEVVHRAVVDREQGSLNQLIGLLYAIPSGISSTQFTRWHLDHHASLGSYEEDPKRHYLSPKRNARWFKALYFTPALFPIYFRAARTEAATYPPELRKRINLERNLTISAHLVLLAVIVYFAGFDIAWKTYLVPYFFVFPVAFALNRLGQHYDIDPSDPAKWSTLIRGSWFWDVIYLFSNYHLEHHYFPSVPFYNLPRLQKLLMPFYEKRGFVSRSYGQLLWSWFVENRKPHSRWEAQGLGGAIVREEESFFP